MAIRVDTRTPRRLLRRIYEAIEANEIRTWEVDRDGDLTHKSAQWAGKLWFRPKVDEKRSLSFFVVPRKNRSITVIEYAVYHSEIVQMLLAHFDDLFLTVSATADPSIEDRVG